MILVIYGAGKTGREIYDLALRCHAKSYRWDKIIFLDDIRQDRTFYGADVCRLHEIEGQKELMRAVIANGIPRNRASMFERLKAAGFQMENLIDPTAIISSTAILQGTGIIMQPYTMLSSNAVLEDNVFLQSFTEVSHDVHIGAHSSISKNVAMGGCLEIGKETYIGLGACIREDLVIGEGCIIGMGAVVLSSVADGTVVVGNPARSICANRHNIFG